MRRLAVGGQRVGVVEVGDVDADQPGVAVVAVAAEAAQVEDVGIGRVGAQGDVDASGSWAARSIVGDRVIDGGDAGRMA